MSIYFPNLLPMYIDSGYCHQRWLVINVENDVTNTDTIIEKLHSNGLEASKEDGYFGNYNEIVCQVETNTGPSFLGTSLLVPSMNSTGRRKLALNIECYKIHDDAQKFITCIRNKSKVRITHLKLDSIFDTIQCALNGNVIDPKNFVPEIKNHTVVF